MLRRTTVFFFTLFPILLFAQAFSKEGRFSVAFAKGCAPLEVNITTHDAFGNITRQYFYEEGASETTATTYTYTSPGTYRLVQIVGIDVTPKTDTLVIEVFEPTDTHFSVSKCNQNGISVTSEEEVYDFIRVYFTPADSFSLNAGETASYSYSSGSTQTFQTKGFYTDGSGTCTTFSHTVTPLPALTTPTILAASIKETCRDHFVLVLDVEGFDPQINYEVEFEQATQTVVYSGFIDSNRLVVDGIGYSRGDPDYCVSIDAIDVCASSRVEGTSFCGSVSDLSLSPFESVYASYEQNGVFIYLDTALAGDFLVYRSLEEGEQEFRRSVKGPFTDPAGSLIRGYFYHIDYMDPCGEVLFSARTNPPIITAKRRDDNLYSMHYFPPVNTLSGLSSQFYEVGNDTEVISSENFDLKLSSENGTLQFVQARAAYSGGITLSSNRLRLKYTPYIYVPAAFTPDGDGLNDTLELFGLPTETATLRIYNRWSQLIHQSDQSKPEWDGTINGSPAPEGTYLYEVIFETSEGEKMNQKGTFVVIRK